MLRNSKIRRGYTKTAIIIVGILIAFMMTIGTDLFTADIIPTNKAKQTLLEDAPGKQNVKHTEYDAGTYIFKLLTKNLPHLNQK